MLGWASPPERVAGWARADSGLTHPHPVCQEACAVFAVAIAEAIARGGPAERIYEWALSWCDAHGREPVVAQILRDARKGPPAVYYPQMGWVRIALLNAFFQLLTAPDAGAAIPRRPFSPSP